MNDCPKIVNRVFICFVIVAIAIFSTGCHTVQWKWFPKSEQNLPNKQFKTDAEPSETLTVLKGSF